MAGGWRSGGKDGEWEIGSALRATERCFNFRVDNRESQQNLDQESE